MSKRSLIIFDWPNLTDGLLRVMEELSQQNDELIILIHRNTLVPRPEGKTCGTLMTWLTGLLSARLHSPYYLFPVTGSGASELHYWLRCKILCPPFEKVYTDNREWEQAALTFLGLPVEWIAAEGARSLPGPTHIDTAASPISRGLFITRAQPFHLGHAAFLEQMATRHDEIIVILAIANRSHQPQDPATAGERMEMVMPWLTKRFPRRFYLLPLPYSDFTMENMYELDQLTPAFQQVYTNNPTIAAMATTAGYPSCKLESTVAISATMIRECILKDLPYRDYVPDSVYRYLQSSAIPQRLRSLHQKEVR